ncbi:sn-glycerol-3-phosphate ABC transporter ATP-binding protein UgpC [Brevibacterium sp. XM4083]|uniref:ABC transporter ATP-binding protein n=1 Tax=Brevibacterium sp. XM4083 TaxID=2583238 RepID=UPI00112A0217|nr:sn-glycerol-3-phosphate ABC transporter ATP-binding protein UgpC [Brevibacterium sp. XM4083]MCM1013209.1 sn-glycerol-3-phosphate ABC transporter ATP-binding protein UgpC [Brevibacterium sp. XM4083]
MVDVALTDVSLSYPGADVPAVSGFDLDIADGEFLVLVGPSGCGKSTTLRMLAGLELPTAGRIAFGGTDVTHVGAKDRDVAMVFQSYALYPHMSVAGNLEFSLKNAGVPKEQRRAQIDTAAAMLELDGLLDRKPRELSGGQRQRVAMGRALVRQPQVFLMDEPLSNLDAKLRVQTRAQIAALQRRLAVTTVYVTHDQTEAMTMGDRVVVMNDGRIEQVGTPRELYDHPASLFVASFIGSPTMNLLPAHRGESTVSVGGAAVPVVRDLPASGAEVVLGIRSEDLRPAAAGEGAFELEVDLVEELGSDTYVYGALTGGAGTGSSPGAETTSTGTAGSLGDRPFVVRLPKGAEPQRGERMWVTADPERARLFDPETKLAIA